MVSPTEPNTEAETPAPSEQETATPANESEAEVEAEVEAAANGESDENAAKTEESATTTEDAKSDDISTTGSEEDSDTGLSPTEDVTELVIKATTLKDEGNAHFKAGDLEKAVQSYRKGTNRLKPLNKNNTGDEQVKSLLLNLFNNLGMVLFKQEKTKLSRDVATKALKIDGTNVKALYRRAVAHRKMGDLDKARDDLKEALKQDANNVAVKKELVAVKKLLVDHKEKQKKALSAAFSKKSGSSLYEDKEKEKQQKLEEQRKKKEEEEKAREKRKAQWEDECVSRMARDEPAISFDDWEKEQEEKAKKRKKEEQQKREEERKAREAARKKAAAASKEAADSDSDDDELTPSELAMMRGYKKTADGRTTSYFTREQSEHEKKLLGDIAPKRLEATSSQPPQPITPTSSVDGSSAAQQKGRPSVWNQAGTWEEKDTTDWCKERLRERLKKTESAAMQSYTANISKVEDLTGDASVAITGGRKRYIFDFHCKLKFKIKCADMEEEAIGDGSLHIPDICSTSHEELEVNFTGWKSRPSRDHLELATQCQQDLIEQIRASVKLWVEDFNKMY